MKNVPSAREITVSRLKAVDAKKAEFLIRDVRFVEVVEKLPVILVMVGEQSTSETSHKLRVKFNREAENCLRVGR